MTFANKKLLVPILAVLVISMSVGTAYALTVTQDKGMGCGSKNWGEREYDNTYTGIDHSFGKNTSCNNVFSFEGRYNTAVMTTALTGNTAVDDIAWQAIYQGTNPWGENADTDGGATYDNSAFPLDSDQSSDYQLKTQWVWTQDKSPNSSDKSIYANYLTNLWFVWDKEGDHDYFLVIDFLWDQLEEDGDTGNWKQRTVSDQDTMPGTQYFDIFCEKIDGDTVYHYNVVLDNTSTTAGTWNEKTANVESVIADAFSYSYDRLDGCTDSTPGSRSNFEIVDQESGIELQAQQPGATGTMKGAYSFSELWY